ncbi:TPA: hypothetical protein QH074_004291 [Enterobacter hormaechei subsp. steigerwaltii]|nr:hypothetical protein [Enterobacter hormaechei subsp. steigerwaltii]
MTPAELIEQITAEICTNLVFTRKKRVPPKDKIKIRNVMVRLYEAAPKPSRRIKIPDLIAFAKMADIPTQPQFVYWVIKTLLDFGYMGTGSLLPQFRNCPEYWGKDATFLHRELFFTPMFYDLLTNGQQSEESVIYVKFSSST